VSLFGRLLGRQRNRWAESWQTYPGAVGDTPALWTVDLGAVDAAPVASLPVRIDVQMPYTAGPDGLPTGHLAEAEDAVKAAVDGLGGAYVGRVASQGQVRFTAHLPTEPTTASAAVDLPQAQVHTEYDPHWAYVRDTLAPDVHQHRLLADRAALVALMERGDQLGTPREVVHGAYFGAEAAAQQAAAELATEGFTISVEPDDEGEFSLTAARLDPVAPPAVHELTWWVQDIVERHDGTYEGWTCDAVA
jgi:Regulator of ribonuclease activity B/Family of unknown function (DUF695)